MDAWGIDAEDYIAAVRAGAIDPHGQTADELQASLDAFDREVTERMLAMTPAEVEAGAQLPPLPGPPESAFEQRWRLDEAFVGRMRALEAQAARIEGERRSLMAAQLQRMVDMGGDPKSRVKELAAMAAVELHLSTGAVIERMSDAWSLVTELPVAHAAAAEGRITLTHLRTIERETRPLRVDTEVARSDMARVVEELVALAERVTPGQLSARARRVVNDVLTAPLQARHDTARQRRRVEVFDVGDGMADLVARIPALEAHAIHDRLTQAARKRAQDDPRTFDQFRADAMQELLLAGTVPEDLHGTSTITAHVAITIPATELLHDPDRAADAREQDRALAALEFPAALDGRVLVDRDTARRLAGGAVTWERLFTDPVTGVAVTVDTYRPSAAQRRWLRARDGSCRGPGCHHPPLRADVDHTRDFAAGGRTSLGNLEHLCRRCHTLKHDSRWRVEQLPGGVLRWTSPIGQVIENAPGPAGPAFADVTGTPPRPPTPSRARRREHQPEQRERREQLRARSRSGSGRGGGSNSGTGGPGDVPVPERWVSAVDRAAPAAPF